MSSPPKKRNPTKGEASHVLTLHILQSMKSCGPLWEDLLKKATKYSLELKNVSAAATAFNESLSQIAQVACEAKGGTTELGKGLLEVVETHKCLESQRDSVCKALTASIIGPIEEKLPADVKILHKFEKDYEKNTKHMKDELKKAERNCEKASKNAKKARCATNALQEGLQNINIRMKDLDDMRQKFLRMALLEERQRYCYLLSHCISLSKAESEAHKGSENVISSKIEGWSVLVNDPDTLPSESEVLISNPSRTLIPIRSSAPNVLTNGNQPETDVNIPPPSFGEKRSVSIEHITHEATAIHGSNTNSSSSIPNSVQDVSVPGNRISTLSNVSSAQSLTRQSITSLDAATMQSLQFVPAPPPVVAERKMRCLWKYEAQEEDQLSFEEEDVIMVTAEEDDGWLYGELHGRYGWFPGNHCEEVSDCVGATPGGFVNPLTPDDSVQSSPLLNKSYNREPTSQVV
eukprot:Nk52_evm8s243 gene=Nk52_evmTU8s243